MRERIWSTNGVAASEHLGLWQQAASAAFVDVTVTADSPKQGLPSIVAARSFGDVEIARIATQPQVVQRRPDHIKADSRHKLFVNLPLTNGTSGRQGDRIARLLPNDFLIVDGTAPFELSFNAPLQQVSVCVTHDMLLPRLPRERDWTAVRVDGTAGLGAFASQTLRNMATMSGPLDNRAARTLGQHAVELVALALGGVLPTRMRHSRTLALQAAREEVDRALSDPELSPASVAERVGISTRYLHSLFSEQGTSFGRWVLGRRLERCHSALVDPERGHDPIGLICFEYGFADPSYFARAYRRAYGTTPSAARRAG